MNNALKHRNHLLKTNDATICIPSLFAFLIPSRPFGDNTNCFGLFLYKDGDDIRDGNFRAFFEWGYQYWQRTIVEYCSCICDDKSGLVWGINDIYYSGSPSLDVGHQNALSC